MWYNSKHTQILDSEVWYDMVFDQYKNYHKHLDSFYDLDMQRFLPRDTKWLNIIDLWAWDGRMYKHFQNIDINTYVACDIASKLLSQHPKQNDNIQIKVCDLESNLPFEDKQFDLATSFFVLEHISNLDNLFAEIYRILSPWGKLLIWHFLQRREFEWSVWKWKKNQKFKIKQYRHKLEEIKENAEYNFFDFEYQEVVNKWVLLWYIIICQK